MPSIELSTNPKAVWNLTWPQMLMMYLVFFAGFIGVWVAGQISSNVQAALGMIMQCSLFLMVLIMAISSGATACISQSLGAGKLVRAQLYIFATIVGSLWLGILIAFPGWLLENFIFELVMVPDELLPMCRDIWMVAILTLPIQYINSASGVLFRATRLVLPPLWVAIIVCCANFIFCLGLGLGYFGLPNYGYMGIMWANFISQLFGAICNCLLLIKSGFLQFKILPSMQWLKKALPYLIKVALPAGAASLVWQSGYLTLFILVASLPTESIEALAGLTAGLRAESIIFMPSMALNMTISILVGNCLGQGRPEKARQIGLQITFAGALLMTLVAACLWPLRGFMAEILSQDNATQQIIISYLSYNLCGTPFSIASQIMGGIMVGAGATKYNLIVYGGTFWAIRLPLGWWLGHKLWGTANGVFVAMVISQVVQSSIMFYVVKYKNWMKYAMNNEKLNNNKGHFSVKFHNKRQIPSKL